MEVLRAFCWHGRCCKMARNLHLAQTSQPHHQKKKKAEHDEILLGFLRFFWQIGIGARKVDLFANESERASLQNVGTIWFYFNSESQWNRCKHRAASKCNYWYLMLFPGTRGAGFRWPLGAAGTCTPLRWHLLVQLSWWKSLKFLFSLSLHVLANT